MATAKVEPLPLADRGDLSDISRGQLGNKAPRESRPKKDGVAAGDAEWTPTTGGLGDLSAVFELFDKIKANSKPRERTQQPSEKDNPFIEEPPMPDLANAVNTRLSHGKGLMIHYAHEIEPLPKSSAQFISPKDCIPPDPNRILEGELFGRFNIPAYNEVPTGAHSLGQRSASDPELPRVVAARNISPQMDARVLAYAAPVGLATASAFGLDTRSEYTYNPTTRQYESKSASTAFALSSDEGEPLHSNTSTQLPNGQPSNWKNSIQPQGTLAQRRDTLVKRLVRDFEHDAHSLLSPGLSERMPSASQIHVFVDNSNISIGFSNAFLKKRGINPFSSGNRRAPPLSFHNLSIVMERGRETGTRILAGSLPRTQTIDEADATGYEICLYERVAKERIDRFPKERKPGTPNPGTSKQESTKHGTPKSGASKVVTGCDSPGMAGPDGATKRLLEQGVDELLHMKLYQTMYRQKDHPSTIVLASGDGAEAENSEGFFPIVEDALKNGWKVEILSFRAGSSHKYKDQKFKNKWKNQFRLIFLDAYVDELAGERQLSPRQN